MQSLFLTPKKSNSLTPGKTLIVSSDEPKTVVIGRRSEIEPCDLVLDDGAVSRPHARIVTVDQHFYLEDLKSKNGTYLNSIKVEDRWPTPLRDGDEIKICSYRIACRIEEESGTITATYQRDSAPQFLDAQPYERLRAILDITTVLSKKPSIDLLLPQIADELFNVFKQADRCLIIQANEEQQLVPVVHRSRWPSPMGERFSRSIVSKCLETLGAYLSEDAATDKQSNISDSIAEAGIRSVMCVPLVIADHKAVGVIQLDCLDRTKKFSNDDLKMLVCVASQASIAIENAQLQEQVLEKQKIELEHKAAKKVQLGLLPRTLPALAGYEFYAYYMAAQTVGGDYYDFIALPDGRQVVLIGDVAGKGVPAALLMARLSGEVRVALLTQPTIADAISYLNAQLMQANLEDKYVTLLAAVLDPTTHRVEFVSAGHPSPFVYRGTTKSLEKVFDKGRNEFPIGWVEGHRYHSRSVELQAGDCLLVYTDGVEDAQSSQGIRLREVGVVRAISTLSTTGPIGVCTLGERLIQTVQTHVGNHPQFDDIAIVCVGRTR